MSRPGVMLDCMGETCPLPLVHLSEMVGQHPPGTIIEVSNDDEGSKVDIPVWCRMRGHEFLERFDRPGGGWVYRLKTGG